MDAIEQYIEDRDHQVRVNLFNLLLQYQKEMLTNELVRSNYVKNFTWMGIPIMQYPSDLMVMQELIWKIKPDVIIETGMAFGGTALFYASILDAIGKSGIMITIDKEIRPHNRKNIDEHPLQYNDDGYKFLIHMIEGDSASQNVTQILNSKFDWDNIKTVMVVLDSNHTHDHVLAELNTYAPLVSIGSYIVVFDTAIQFYGHLDKNQDRPWGKGNNPWTAVQEFLETDIGNDFVIDKEVEQRALITAAPDGWLRRVR